MIVVVVRHTRGPRIAAPSPPRPRADVSHAGSCGQWGGARVGHGLLCSQPKIPPTPRPSLRVPIHKDQPLSSPGHTDARATGENIRRGPATAPDDIL
eukprot:974092-Pyramimonas_sp.AAC.1